MLGADAVTNQFIAFYGYDLTLIAIKVSLIAELTFYALKHDDMTSDKGASPRGFSQQLQDHII